MSIKISEGESPYRSADAAAELDAMAIAGALFRDCAEDLTRLRERVNAGAFEEVKDAVKLVRDLRAATQLLLEERNKVDKLRKEMAGRVGAGELDLAAARHEIGRRLACLRRARGG